MNCFTNICEELADITLLEAFELLIRVWGEYNLRQCDASSSNFSRGMMRRFAKPAVRNAANERRSPFSTRFRTLSRGCWKEDLMEDTKNVPAVYEGRRDLADELPAYQERVRQLLRASVTPETHRAYASRLKRFFAWCQAEGVSTAFPTLPEVLAAYVASLADSGAAPATVE